MKKAHVNLMMHASEMLGLIVLMPSGVVFTNQTGGTACMHPDAEGIFVPLYFSGKWPIELESFWWKGWEHYDSPQVQVCLDGMELNHILEPVPLTDFRMTTLAELDGWGEAWIPVRIKEAPEHTDNWEALHDFVGHYAILTYSNSD